jgi:hypothetical protein
VTEDDALELLLIRLADGGVLAKTDTDYFRNSRVAANRREAFAIWSPDNRMVIRKLDVRYGTGEFTLYRIALNGVLAGIIDLTKIVEPAVRARFRQIGRDPKVYLLSIGETRLGNDGTLHFPVIMFVVQKETEADFTLEMRLTPGNGPLHTRIVSIRKPHVEERCAACICAADIGLLLRFVHNRIYTPQQLNARQQRWGRSKIATPIVSGAVLEVAQAVAAAERLERGRWSQVHMDGLVVVKQRNGAIELISN